MVRSKKPVAAAGRNQTNDKTAQDREREGWIAAAAYYLAEARNFAPGAEVADWLAAERRYLDQSGGD